MRAKDCEVNVETNRNKQLLKMSMNRTFVRKDPKCKVPADKDLKEGDNHHRSNPKVSSNQMSLVKGVVLKVSIGTNPASL